MEWAPTVGKKPGDVLIVGSDDGKYRLFGKTNRFEKTVDAHQGAITTVRWSSDASSCLTAGEDGALKVWSRSGMLRSVLAQAAWGPGSNSVVFGAGKTLVVQPMNPGSKGESWKAHEGIVLAVDWSVTSGQIVSGGEDCRYKVWDSLGRVLYTSSVHEHPITSLRFNPASTHFAVAGYNMLRLCDAAGWSAALANTDGGSVYELAWLPDGTAVAGACADGQVFVADIVGHSINDDRYEVTQSAPDTLTVRRILENTTDVLELRERLVMMDLTSEYLVAITTSQCLIYRTATFSTPLAVELKAPVVMMKLASSCLLLVDSGGNLAVYSMDGRLMSNPKVPNMTAEAVTLAQITLNNDTLAIVHPKDDKQFMTFDVQSGKELRKPVTHSVGIASLALEQSADGRTTYLALVDKNRDLYLSQPRRSQPRLEKLASMIQDVAWHGSVHMIVALLDGKLSTWLYPRYVELFLPLMQAGNCTRNSCLVRRADGAKITLVAPSYAAMLHGFVKQNKWNEAVRLARLVKERSAWGCLAAMATHAKQLSTAEIAYAAVDAVDKVAQIQYIKSLPTEESRNAEMALLSNQAQEAESLLLQSGLIYRAIDMNCSLCRWDRALDLAIKHKTHVDTVLGLRQQHLQAMGQRESLPKFIEYAERVDVDWTAVEAKIAEEWDAERARPGARPYAA
ncbi:uncharacterized protein MONBRDRAFT_33490 [Monosiga brevicollis MX1]|uniref:Intraflagellar transport protein 80 n=1 Tax=Monosiga brevicollis TaxID=81824 RepID=A9V5N6_MONBE|nr:uncharacterized protein MONBRDRAFT_33490 [Monosiga brevicollis MX1]EDQ87072.1 predicted protein [Monosiga brevicollis MX1]|eukprot:XP_001748015.1 hypothetical protein [Monosiga brevicollis MX1]